MAGKCWMGAPALAFLLVLGGGHSGVSAAGARSKTAGDELFNGGVVPKLELLISPENLKVLQEYHQVWRQARPPRVDVSVSVREGSRTYTNVSVHLKGSYTFQDVDQKPSLTLNFDKLAPGQRFHGLQKIHLNNSVQDPSYLSEALARELFRDLGVPAPRAGHAFVGINGRDAGFYVLMEGWNKQFLHRHFESVKGNLYDGGSGGDVTKLLEVDSGDKPADHADLTNLVAAARVIDPGNRLVRLARVLDIERFRNFAAMEILVAHWDGYCAGAPNNYRVFHDVSRDKMVFMPHGMDQLFGVSSSPDFSITPNFNGIVAKGLFSIPDERRRYLERIALLLTNEFRVANLHAKVDRMAGSLRASLEESALRRQFDEAVAGLKSRITVRVASVGRQLQAPETALAFDPGGVARLTGWRYKGPNDRPALPSRATENGRQLLQIQGRGPASSGAWRTVVLLDEGHYEFAGLGRAVEILQSATNTGVILRVSGERSPAGLSTNAQWTPLRYEFDVHGIANTELVAEFRGAQGTGSFDVGEFKLFRRDKSRNAKSPPR
ncbi:MAG: spore coat protein [Verrucomicrobiota bacterium]